ncbi:hypothetical protein WICPIJ_004793 [Wickerhamomyces pijperi]|uniref:Secreted protein n=1 Tax=Wickerhamomyces pijperi TaxID=599730 RepID=A0A9P8Q560_WICPI|nr:hypothetical protein WICPIJ_004793 [Wickerhamomyces pijperi]
MLTFTSSKSLPLLLRLALSLLIFTNIAASLPTKSHNSLKGPSVTPLIGARPNTLLILERQEVALVRQNKNRDDNKIIRNIAEVAALVSPELAEDEEDLVEEDGIYLDLYPLTITSTDSESGSTTIASFVCETYTPGAFECVQYDDFTNVFMYFYGEGDAYTSFFINETPKDITTTNYLEYHRSYEALKGPTTEAGSDSDEGDQEDAGSYGEYDLFISVDVSTGETYVCDHSPQCAPFTDFTEVYVNAFGHHGYTELFNMKFIAESPRTATEEASMAQHSIEINPDVNEEDQITSTMKNISSPSNTLQPIPETTTLQTSAPASSSNQSTTSDAISSTVLFLESSFNAHDPPGLTGSNLIFGVLSVMFLGLLF